MADGTTSYQWHSVPKRLRNIVSFLCVAACVWVAFHARTTTLVFVSVAFAFGAVAAQVDQRVCIDQGAREVSRRIALWGWCFWSSRWPLDDFTGIGAYRLPTGSPQASADLVHVGLRRETGGILAVRYFSAKRRQPCPEAEEFARSLGEAADLEFHEAA